MAAPARSFAARATEPGEGKEMRLLIVEDEPNLGQQLRNALESAG